MKEFLFSKKTSSTSGSQDELDHLMVIVKLPRWIPLGALAFVCLAALIWSIWGRLPITVNGVGVLINPGTVKVVQAQAAGLVKELLVKPGQEVKAGDPVALVEQPAREQSVRQARENFQEIKTSNTQSLEVNAKRFTSQLQSLERQKALLRENKRLFQSVQEATDRRYQSLQELAKDGLANKENLLGAESALVESLAKMATYEVQIQDLELQREMALQQNVQTEFNLKTQIEESRRNLEREELQLEQTRQVRSSIQGKVLEVMVSVGRVVSFGTIIVSIETQQEGQTLKNLCYFSVKDGKQIVPNMRILVTPTTVKRERFGGIVGRVTKVSPFPISREAAMNVVGSEELAGALTKEGAMIEVEAELEPSKTPGSISQFEWSSKNPPVAVTQGTVTMNRVTVEQRAPITYAMPLLRSWLEGQKDDFLPGM